MKPIGQELIVSHEDERVAKLQALAEPLLAEAMRLAMEPGTSEPGHEKLQALHFAVIATVNRITMEPGDELYAMGGVIGSMAENYEDPIAAIQTCISQALDVLQQVKDRRALVAGAVRQ